LIACSYRLSFTCHLLVGGRPEDQTSSRRAYKWTASNAASDLGGSVAAALAATSMVFRSASLGNSVAFANQLLEGAEQVLAFARAKEGYWHSSLSRASIVYKSTTYWDDLAYGCGWVYKAKYDAGRDDPQLLADAEVYFQNDGKTYAPDWDSLWVPHAVNMMNLQQYLHCKETGCQTPIDDCTPQEYGGNGKMYGIHGRYCRFYYKFLESWILADGTNSIVRTPKGLKYPSWSTKGNLAFSANAAMMMVLEAKYNATWRDAVKIPLARSQADYILGSTGFSFLIGFGGTPQSDYPQVDQYPYTYNPGTVSVWPRYAHHPSSSCPLTGTCDGTAYTTSDPNKQLLVGGLVGGPAGMKNDRKSPDATYYDVRNDDVTNQCAVHHVSGLTSLLAGLYALV
jgi:endoglucanase